MGEIKIKKKTLAFFVVTVFVMFFGVYVFSYNLSEKTSPLKANSLEGKTLEARFNILSNANSNSCGGTFMFVDSLPEDGRIQGSCCSAMDFHRYSEQIEGLKKYRNFLEIPPDPYNVNAGLAKEMIAYYDLELTAEEQGAYDYAMANSHEKGPCCCKCWRWYVYGGLAKKLIHEHGFTGEQIVDVWNLSDGCGGDGEHVSEHHM